MGSAPPEAIEKKFEVLGVDLIKVSRHAAFWPGVALLLAMVFAFFQLFKKLPALWFNDEGYYSHGVLVPFIAGYIIYKWWPKLSQIPVRPFWPAILPLLGCLFVFQRGYLAGIDQAMSFAVIASLIFAQWMILGGRWTLRLLIPTLYLIFMLPVWTAMIDQYTNSLQLLSTQVAFKMLDITGFRPFQDSPTVIYLNHFTLDVGVPCSGFKLVLAVSAFTIFFMCIAKLNVWANMIMAAMVVPICLFINGLRIALIGVVGDYYGRDAGHAFHDYSGYLTLLVCFYLLFKIARVLGWKD